jgi:hypothetical protein
VPPRLRARTAAEMMSMLELLLDPLEKALVGIDDG